MFSQFRFEKVSACVRQGNAHAGRRSALITACQNDPVMDITKLAAETDPPEAAVQSGFLANLNAGKMTEAARKFGVRIDRQHPFSEYARKALVMNAFVSYLQRPTMRCHPSGAT